MMKLRITVQSEAPIEYWGKIIGASCGGTAILYWSNGSGPLAGWAELTRGIVEADGSGKFLILNGRGIPPEATHIFAVMLDRPETAVAPLPARRRSVSISGLRLSVFADLHLTKKPWRLRKALRQAADSDAVLLLGDLVNDGLPEQFELLWSCIKETAQGLPVLAVAGNHDYPLNPIPQVNQLDFPRIQNRLFSRLDHLGFRYGLDSSGAYAVNFGQAEVIGLNAGSHWRKLGFAPGSQLDWLKIQLEKNKGTWHVILCHAPLVKHNPLQNQQPYLGMDRELQQIIDAHKNIIFLSGHTHLSCNCRDGCVEMDGGNVYANLASLCPSVLRPAEPLATPSWTEPAIHKIHISESGIEIVSIGLSSCAQFPRSYYRF